MDYWKIRLRYGVFEGLEFNFDEWDFERWWIDTYEIIIIVDNHNV